MRVLLASDIYLPLLSGIADSIALLGAELERRGHEVLVLAPRPPRGEEEAEASPLPVTRLPTLDLPGWGGLSLAVPVGAGAAIDAFSPDLVHVHTFSTLGIAALRHARRRGLPVLGTDHTYPAAYLHYAKLDVAPLRRGLDRFAARFYGRCDAVTAPSRALLDTLAAQGLARPTEVVSNPIDARLFAAPEPDERAAARLALGLHGPAVLLFGRVAAEKDPEVAVESFARLPETLGATLLVVGDGPARGDVERLVEARGLSARVRLLGALRGATLREAVIAGDACLIASRSETQSMTTIQALHAGVPVVAVRAGGLPEYVRDGETGFLAEPGDAAGLAAALGRLLGEPALRDRLSRAAPGSVSRFTPEAVASRFESLYRSLVVARACAPHGASVRT